MDRRAFIRLAGLGGAAALLPARALFAAGGPGAALARAAHFADGTTGTPASAPMCVLTPQETAGPYPLELSADTSIFRRAIAEGKAGIPLRIALKVVDLDNACAPVPDARVDVWHCDKDGYYSGYVNSGYLGTRAALGQTFCRGIQLTDAQGVAVFDSIYPGWYSGRVQHVHFQVYRSDVLTATSQLAFPESLNTAVNNSPLYAAHGQNPTKNTNDSVFSDGTDAGTQIAGVGFEPPGYVASLTVGLAAPTGIIRGNPAAAERFSLGAARVDRVAGAVEIPVRLAEASDVRLDVYDLHGRHVARQERTGMGAGTGVFRVTREDASAGSGWGAGSFAYQVTVRGVAPGAPALRRARLLTWD